MSFGMGAVGPAVTNPGARFRCELTAEFAICSIQLAVGQQGYHTSRRYWPGSVMKPALQRDVNGVVSIVKPACPIATAGGGRVSDWS